LCSSSLGTEDNTTEDNVIEDNVIEYRRWLVPFENIDDIPFPSEPYLPMSRQRFEHWIELFEQKSDKQNVEQPYFSKIVLKAKLDDRQLTSGQGFATLSLRSDEFDSIPLNPLTLAISSLRWSNGAEAILFCDPDEGNQLRVPTKSESASADPDSYSQLQFRWSMQRRKDYRSSIVFDIALPPCLSIELQLDLPESLELTASVGLVLPDDNASNSAFRTWRVLLGHHSSTTLTLTANKALSSLKQKSAIRQIITHEVTPQGLNTLTRIIFDRLDIRPEELFLEMEQPLRLDEVKYGDQEVPWTTSTVSPGITEVRIDLSSFAHEEQSQELQIRSLGPLLENQRWTLPRVRVTSPDVIWVYTRCGVSILAPLRVRNLIYHQAVQVSPLPTTAVNWAERELYVFHFFQDDAQIELDVVHSIPQIMVNSVAQIEWGSNEIRSTVYLDCSITEGERFTLNFPVSEQWIIDSITSYPPPGTSSFGTSSAVSDPIFSTSVLEDAESPTRQTLSVQLNRPMRPQTPVTLQLSCRSINSSQDQFPLSELSPLVLSHRHGGSHYIAVQHDRAAFNLQTTVDASTFSIPRPLVLGGHSLSLEGGIYPLDSRTQDIRFNFERTSPNYSAAISGNAYIDNGEMILTYRIQCVPDSAIDIVYVYFTPLDKKYPQWNWSMPGIADSSRLLRTRKLSPDELKELLPMLETQNRSDDWDRDEIWEIRLDGLQSAPFDLSAKSFIPLADSMSIPFVSLPHAASQRGELTIESPQQFDYRIVSSRLHSIPIAPPSWDRYQNVRAAFRYDPQEELRHSQHTPLLLQKLTPGEQTDTAWIWSLRLDSQYEPEGMVRNKALFLVENQGKDVLRIKLPTRIDVTHVSSIWRDSQQIPLKYDADQRTIAVSLPVGQRFVSIAIEYTYQDMPLVQQRKLRLHYPTADVPILSGSWISWFPPEFEVSLRDTSAKSMNKVLLSRTLEYLLTGAYRSYIGAKWDDIFYGRLRQRETEEAAQYFFEEIVDTLHKKPISTWGDLIGSESMLSALRLRLKKNNNRDIETKLLIDKQALAFLGITPATPIEDISSITDENVREKLFEKMGLVLIVATRARSDGIKDYVFALSTPTTLSLNLQIRPISSGRCVRIVPFEIVDPDSKKSSGWLPTPRWLSETTLTSIPWSVTAQGTPWSALISDWNAYELSFNTEQPLYVVHRQKFLALQWIAFLALVLLTCRKPFSSPIVLFALLIVFELIARSVASCYVGIPSGAFLGVLVSIGFVLIRSKINPSIAPPERPFRDDSTECSVSFVPTPLLHRCFLLGALLAIFAGMCVPARTQTFSEPITTPRKEPYRVYYPTDSEGQVVGNLIWIPVEFVEFLNRNVKLKNPTVSGRWNIVKAVYQGSLIRGQTGNLECSDDFKAIYEIYLDTSHATITLPNLPAVQGKIYWDSKPLWKDDTKNDTLSFLIENETPGKHTLEIALSPIMIAQNEGTLPLPATQQIAFAIPRVPDSVLRLNVPPDMPLVNVPDAMGAVSANASGIQAELGPVDQLSLSWVDSPSRGGTLVSEVEQLLWIRAKPSQIELNALFRYRIDETVQHLTIQTDPRWQRSGPFSCDEHRPITQRTETIAELQTHTGQSFYDSYEVAHIDFQSPVSGTLTLRANFVLRDFYGADTFRNFFGAGNLRMPEFKALRSRISRSLLGISADPILDLDYPTEGRSSGFESSWYGSSTIATPFLGEFWGFASPLLPKRNEDAPDVTYDLTKTEPTWTVNVRTKKTFPNASVVQSVHFDTGESRVHVVGEFTTESNVDIFQQRFSADSSIQIETIEVRDSRNDPVEARLQQITSATMSAQYLILFRQPVTEKYTVTVHGCFETDTQADLSQQPVPLLTFNESLTIAHSLNLFRTPAVIAEISPEQSGWSKSSTIPSAPESFTQSIPLGTWQKASATGRTSTVTEERNEPLQFALLSNRPRIQCRTSLSLLADSDERWVMTLAFTGDITSGELKSLSFNWDERCGTILSVEPAATCVIDPSGKILTLSPAEPMQGKQQFNMTVSLNTTGGGSLPNVFPLGKGIDQFESELFVDLPYKQGNEIIPWELNLLEALDEHVPQHGLAESARLFHRAVDTDFSASIGQVEARLTAVFYDIGFLVKRNGTMIGIATIDLKNRGQDHFVLQMPLEFELLQISSAGSILERTRLDENNRWRINIGTSDYPQRLSVLFRTSFRLPLEQWNREHVIAMLQFPLMEGVVVQDTIWTVAFEGNIPTINVTSVLQQHENLGNHVPVSGTNAILSQIGLNLIREHNLLRVLNSLPVTVRQEETWRWYSHWLEEWNTVADKVDYQVAHLPLTVQSITPKLIIRPIDPAREQEESIGIVRPFLKTMSAKSREALRDNKEQSVREKFGTTADTIPKYSTPILNSQVYWQGRSAEEMQHLFGAEEGMIRAVQLTSVPSEGGWTIHVTEHVWLFISLTFLVPILVLLSVRWVHLAELWLQFPHFWGLVLGVLLWTFLPESFVGLILIVLTIASFFRPSWTRRRYVSRPF